MTELIILIVVVGAAVYLYRPLAKELYRRWKNVQLRKRTHGPLLGVVFPPEQNKED